jgi:hypothetical protein
MLLDLGLARGQLFLFIGHWQIAQAPSASSLTIWLAHLRGADDLYFAVVIDLDDVLLIIIVLSQMNTERLVVVRNIVVGVFVAGNFMALRFGVSIHDS